MVLVIMSGWGALGGYIEDLYRRGQDAANPANTEPETNALRRACDWAARKGGLVGGAPQTQLACRRYWDGQQDYTPPGDGSPQGPGWTGGQCDGVEYRIRGDWQDGCRSTPLQQSIGRYFGPIVTIEFFPSVAPMNAGVRVVSEGGANERFFFDECGAVNPSTGFTNITVSRVDGQPDTCGNPPGGEGGTTEPVNVPDTVLPPNGNPVDISDPNDPSDPTPPITFPDTDTPFDPFIPIVDPPPGWPPFVFPPVSDPAPVTGEPVETTGTGEETDMVEDGITELIGYEFEVYGDENFQSVIPGTNPRIYTTVVGSVQLRLEDGQGRVFRSDNLQITSKFGSIVRTERSLLVTGINYNCIPELGGLRLRQIRGVQLS